MKKTLTIIGCGKVGKTLGRLWHAKGTFAIQDVLNRSLASSERAVSFIGAGRAASDYAALRPADIILIGCTDDQVAQCCQTLSRAGRIAPGAIVFHCSGA
ncbi:MAG: hypothetical protein V7642_1045, partial [Burkholderiales bacterium]